MSTETVHHPLAALARAIARRPAVPLALALGLAVLAGIGASRVRVDPGNEALFLRSDPALEAQEVFVETFGGDETVLVALEGPVFTPGNLEALDRLTRALGEVPGIVDATSITNARTLHRGASGVHPFPPYRWVRDGLKDVDEFERDVLDEPLLRGNLISADGRMAAIVCRLEIDAGRQVVRTIRTLARERTPDGLRHHVAGFPVERFEFASLIREDQRRFVPLILGAIALVTFLVFRRPWGVLLPLAVVGLSVSGTLAVAHLASTRLNAVTSMLTPVVMVVSVTVSLNVCLAYGLARREVEPGEEAIGRAWDRVGLACVFTSLTTAIGFASLAISEVPAIRSFGLLCALGVLISFGAALLLIPALTGLPLRWGPRALEARPGRLETLLGRLGPAVVRRRRVVLVGALLVVAGAAWGIARIRVETDILQQLPPGSDLARATRAIDEELDGVNAMEILLEGPPGAFRRREPLEAMARLERTVLDRPDLGVRRTFSILSILRRIHEVRTSRGGEPGRPVLPPDDETLEYTFGLVDRAGDDSPVSILLSEDASVARLQVRLRTGRASRVRELLDLVRESARDLPEGITARPTGEFVLIQSMTAVLPIQQAWGLGLAALLIVAAIGLLFRSSWAILRAAVPATLPVLLVYGLMGWFGVDLSTATSLIASVVLGLAVDSTILLLWTHMAARRAGTGRLEATEHVLSTVGQSVTISNLALVCGFAVCAFSAFPPIRDFGLLTAGAIGGSYLAAVTLIPVLCHLGRPAPTGEDGGAPGAGSAPDEG